MAESKYPNKSGILLMISKTTFRQFDKEDWYNYSGCQSKDPMIGSYGDFEIVIDGDDINVIHCDDEYGGALYTLTQISYAHDQECDEIFLND